MKVICAWYKEILVADDGKGGLDSHGICPKCKAKVEEER